LDLFDYKISLDTDAKLRLIRRIKRDLKERRRSINEILTQYSTSVKPMFEKFVQPFLKLGDLVIKETDLDKQIELINNVFIKTKIIR